MFVDPEPRADFLRLKLGERGYTLVRKDVRDLPALIETIQRHGIETVVHTAGLIGGRVQQSLSLAFDINLGGTRNVAEAVRLCGVRRLVHISTFGVYDRRREANGPVTEDFPRGGERGYGNYKVAKEMILEAYANAHRFELIMLRPANVFGARALLVGIERRPEDAAADRSRAGGTNRENSVVGDDGERIHLWQGHGPRHRSRSHGGDAAADHLQHRQRHRHLVR